jgi:hypothetical protein
VYAKLHLSKPSHPHGLLLLLLLFPAACGGGDDDDDILYVLGQTEWDDVMIDFAIGSILRA